jgi:hypothetical protein
MLFDMDKNEFLKEYNKISSEILNLKIKRNRILKEYILSSDTAKEFRIGNIVKVTVNGRKPVLAYVKDYELDSQNNIKLILWKVNKNCVPYNVRLWYSEDDVIENFLQIEHE